MCSKIFCKTLKFIGSNAKSEIGKQWKNLKPKTGGMGNLDIEVARIMAENKFRSCKNKTRHLRTR